MKPISFATAIFIGAILNVNAASSISVITPAFQAGGDIPAKFSCNGANVNPELKINGVPSEAKSLVLIVDDPDAPRGLFTHWIVWNIDPKATDIAENSTPAGGLQGTNDFGKRNYGGPCPPSGTHRYFFKVFALDTKLDLKSNVRRAELDAAMRSHTVAQGELMARYTHK
jgi:Raf kinase inhibitor-like YbhB/YbcL family protein